MNIAINGKAFDYDSRKYIQQVFDELNARNATILSSKSFFKHLKKGEINTGDVKIYQRQETLRHVDFMLSLGGDGTLLETLTHIGALEKPILGINTGRLGFLATTPKTQIARAMEAIFKDNFAIDPRSLIRFDSDKEIFGDINFGLNEFTIVKKDTSSMIVVHTYIDGEYLNSYWADGLIVSTPTGSTGYSISCGGPVVLPQSNNFILTPVSPHNLNIRPLVVSDESVISFEIEGRSKNFLVSLDSRSCSVDATIQMAVRKELFKAKLVKIDGYDFLDTLRQKLNWGLDARN